MHGLPQLGSARFVESLPRVIFWSTAVFLLVGCGVFVEWWRTGDPFWIRLFFAYPGALFFLACAGLQSWLSLQCWRFFSPGDLLRPAWFLIFLSALSAIIGGFSSHILGLETPWNPLSHVAPRLTESLAPRALEIGPLFGPLSMLFLACGLWYVVRACRHNGILGRMKGTDLLLPGVVVTYTLHYFITVVFSPTHGGQPVTVSRIIGWTSDPLLCILLIEAIILRRSTQRVGWGLISRCWVSFTAAIFLTSVGDIGLWASASGYLSFALQGASWYIWFLASACYTLGPTYQLMALHRATRDLVSWEPVPAPTRDCA